MSAQVTSQISLDDQNSGNYKAEAQEQKIEYEEEMKKIWAAIKHLKEDKVDKDTFDTKIYEIE
jgi:head-tail adaptor